MPTAAEIVRAVREGRRFLGVDVQESTVALAGERLRRVALPGGCA